ncbi:hypothetical protein J6590_077468 [Homalodisca vitripennis]|nr:hypothetical protein J6590_077468 [Homalodisca vitripennis]
MVDNKKRGQYIWVSRDTRDSRHRLIACQINLHVSQAVLFVDGRQQESSATTGNEASIYGFRETLVTADIDILLVKKISTCRKQCYLSMEDSNSRAQYIWVSRDTLDSRHRLIAWKINLCVSQAVLFVDGRQQETRPCYLSMEDSKSRAQYQWVSRDTRDRRHCLIACEIKLCVSQAVLFVDGSNKKRGQYLWVSRDTRDSRHRLIACEINLCVSQAVLFVDGRQQESSAVSMGFERHS